MKTVPIFRILIENPIILILIFASVLRFWGIWHGYPFPYYGDEQHFVNRAVSFGSGDMNPHWFHKPAFLMYILFFEYGLFFLIGKLLGFFSNGDSFAIYYFQNSWPFILIGRITVTLFGISTIYVVYKIGERFWSKITGLYCGIFLTLSYGHIFCGQDVKADVPTTFFTVLSIYFLLKVVNNNSFSKKDYILAGLFAGLGTATKYYSIVLLPCILIVSTYEIINKRNILLFRKFLYSLFSFWSIYFVVSPYNFLDPLGRRWTFHSIASLFNKISPYKLNLYASLEGSVVKEREAHYIFNSLINYIKVILTEEGVGIIIGVMLIISICYILYKTTFKKIVLLLFPVLFSIVSIVMNPSYTETRHQLIIYPLISIVTGIAIYEITRNSLSNLKINIILSLLLIFPFVSIIKNNIYISKTDTRTLAKYWIESNITQGTKILVDDDIISIIKNSKQNLKTYYEKSKQFETGQFTTHLEKYFYYQMQASSGITYDVKEIRHMWWRNEEISDGESEAVTEYDKEFANPIREVGINDYEFYVRNGYEYAVVSSISYNSFINPESSRFENFPSYRKFYENLFSKGKLVKEFNHKKLGLPGSTVKIFKIK